MSDLAKKYQAIKKIVDERQHGKVDGVGLDAFTAGMLVQICEKLNPTNRAKFLSMPIDKMVDVGWKISNSAWKNSVPRYAAKIKTNDKQFGTLLQPGDRIKIKNLITNKEVERVVDRFDGLEYRFTDMPDPKNRLGHSGYSVEGPNDFTIYINREPHLKITKVASAKTAGRMKEIAMLKDDLARLSDEFDYLLENDPDNRGLQDMQDQIEEMRSKLHAVMPSLKMGKKLPLRAIPKDYPVQPLKPGQTVKGMATCLDCGLSWDDSKSTSMTPTPSGRCPFEWFHK